MMALSAFDEKRFAAPAKKDGTYLFGVSMTDQRRTGCGVSRL